MSGESNLLLRHGERVFGPVSLGQVRELLAAGTIAGTDSVREENGPWVLIRDYLEWKEADAAPVADISELLSKPTPKPTPKPASKPAPKPAPKPARSSPSQPAAKPAHDPDYIPLADPDPDPGLGETKEMDKSLPPRHSLSGDLTGGSAGGRAGRPKSRAEPTGPGKGRGGSSNDVIPLAAVSETRPAIPSTPSRPDHRSRGTLDNIALPEDADLDAILRAMVAHEQTAPPLKPGGRR